MPKVPKNKVPPRQLACQADRDLLHEYVTRRLKELAREKRRGSGERTEGAWIDGAEVELICALDELLGEQPPDRVTKRRSD